MVLFRCVTGGTGGFEIAITTEDTDLYGQTITISKNGSTVGTTAFDNTGNASYTVTETGTYSVSVTYEGRTVTETVEVTAFAVDIAMGFVLEKWLEFGDISGTYASLSDVLADEDAVRQLMTIHAAVDYLASFESTDASVVTILNDNYAAKWISLTDYAMDVLEAAYGTLMASIGKYGYGEWALIGKVPKMTSNTAPSGRSFCTVGGFDKYPPYQAFDGDNSTAASTKSTSSSDTDTGRVAYDFGIPVNVRAYAESHYYSSTNTLSYSDDGTTWTDVGDSHTSGSGGQTPLETYYVDDFGAHRYWGVHYVGGYQYTSYNCYTETVFTLQFYAWQPKGNVPVMTSNTAPYGEAICSSYNSSYPAYQAFDGNDSTPWANLYSKTSDPINEYVGYKFVNPVCAKRARIRSYYNTTYGASSSQYKIEATNDPSGTWTTLYTGSIDTSTSAYKDYEAEFDDNETYYLCYRVLITNHTMRSGSYFITEIDTFQLFGRTLKVSVPKMSGNTTPYGEAIGDAEWGYAAVGDGLRWRVFDRDTTTTIGKVSGKNTGKIGYKFPSPVVIREICLYGNYSAGAQTIQLQGSNDGVTYENVGSVFTYNQSLAYTIIKVTNNTPYAYYLLNITGSTSTSLGFRELNFFGVDYSEREWDTTHPRRYLYDHGVEVETLDGSSFTVDTTYSITGNVKNPSDLELHAPSGNYCSSFGTNATIDNSGGAYSLLFVNINQARLGTTPLIMSVATTKAAYSNNRLGLLNPSVPYSGSLQALDVSNMLQSFYCVLDAPSNRWANVNEWWLE